MRGGARRRLLDVAIGGLAARPAVGSVIAGAPARAGPGQRPGRRWEPTVADLAALDEITELTRQKLRGDPSESF